MSESVDIFERLFELLKHEELRKALFVVLPSAALAGFWIGRYFPKHPPSATPVVPSAPTSSPLPDPRILELEAQINNLKEQLSVGPEAVRKAREAVALSGPGLWQKDEFGLRDQPTKLLPRSCFIPEVKELGRAAGTRIGYLSRGEL